MKMKAVVGGNWNSLGGHVYNHSKRKGRVVLADSGKNASGMKTLKTERVEGVGHEAFAVVGAMAEYHMRTMTRLDEHEGEGAMDVVEEVEGRRCMVGMGRRRFPCSRNGDTLGTGRQRTWLKSVEEDTPL